MKRKPGSQKKEWYSKFEWSAWLSDGGLRRVSFAARGLWMDMLAYMHDNEEVGFITTSGRAATNTEIAKMVGGEVRQVVRLLGELEANGVLSRDARGAVFSRRMTRENRKSREFAEWGAQGGNPLLNKISELEGNRVKPKDNPSVTIATVIAREGTEPTVQSEATASPPADDEKTPTSQVFSDGLGILAKLTGRDLVAHNQPLRRLMGKLRQRAKNDDVRLMDILRRSESQPPAEAISWINGCLNASSPARLVVDNNDPRGIQTWCRSVPGVKPTVGDAERRDGNWVAHGWVIDCVAESLGEAAELPAACRFDWSLLVDWLAAGIEPDDMVRRIKTGVTWLRKQPDGYIPPSSLKLFDTFVRGARRVA